MCNLRWTLTDNILNVLQCHDINSLYFYGAFTSFDAQQNSLLPPDLGFLMLVPSSNWELTTSLGFNKDQLLKSQNLLLCQVQAPASGPQAGTPTWGSCRCLTSCVQN